MPRCWSWPPTTGRARRRSSTSALLDALGVAPGIAVVTKIDAVEPDAGRRGRRGRDRPPRADVPCRLAGPRRVRRHRGGAGRRSEPRWPAWPRRSTRPARPPTLAIDRVFAVKGRGAVVTGTLRGGPLARGDTLRLVPGDRDVRVREIQVHGAAVDRVEGGGRTALNLAGIGTDELHRGMVLTADPAVRATDRALVTFRWPVADRTRARLHSGTAAVDASVGRAGAMPWTCPTARRRGSFGWPSRSRSRRAIDSSSGAGPSSRRSAASSSTSRRRGASRAGARPRAAGREPGSAVPRGARLELHGAVSDGGRDGRGGRRVGHGRRRGGRGGRGRPPASRPSARRSPRPCAGP